MPSYKICRRTNNQTSISNKYTYHTPYLLYTWYALMIHNVLSPLAMATLCKYRHIVPYISETPVSLYYSMVRYVSSTLNVVITRTFAILYTHSDKLNAIFQAFIFMAVQIVWKNEFSRARKKLQYNNYLVINVFNFILNTQFETNRLIFNYIYYIIQIIYSYWL